MRYYKIVSVLFLSGVVGVYGSGLTEQRILKDFVTKTRGNAAVSENRMKDLEGFDTINKTQENFLRYLQSSRILKADLSKVDDKVDEYKLEVEKSIEAQKYLDQYLVFVNSLNRNDLEMAVKEYAERSYSVLQSLFKDTTKCNVFKLQLDYQDFSIPGRDRKYPKFYGYKLIE